MSYPDPSFLTRSTRTFDAVRFVLSDAERLALRAFVARSFERESDPMTISALRRLVDAIEGEEFPP